MSRSEMEDILGRYEAAAAQGDPEQQLIFSRMRFAFEEAVRVGLMPERPGEPSQPGPGAESSPQASARLQPITRADALGGRATLGIVSEILAGNLLNGQELKEVQISEALGISRQPLREAKATLEASGLLLARPARSSIIWTGNLPGHRQDPKPQI